MEKLKKNYLGLPLFVSLAIGVISFILIMVGSFLDLDISKGMLDKTDGGAFFANYGGFISYFIYVFAGVLFFKAFRKKGNKKAAWGLLVLSYLVAMYFALHYFGPKMRDAFGYGTYNVWGPSILTIIYTKSDTKNNLKKFKENVKIKRELIKNASNEELADCIGIFLKDYVKNDINRKCSEKFTFSLEKDSLGKYEKRGIPTLDEVIPVIEETIKETYDKLGLTCNYDKFANMVRPIYIGKSDDKIKNAVETEDCIFAERI